VPDPDAVRDRLYRDGRSGEWYSDGLYDQIWR
jgi:hypothetical protein